MRTRMPKPHVCERRGSAFKYSSKAHPRHMLYFVVIRSFSLLPFWCRESQIRKDFAPCVLWSASMSMSMCRAIVFDWLVTCDAIQARTRFAAVARMPPVLFKDEVEQFGFLSPSKPTPPCRVRLSRSGMFSDCRSMTAHQPFCVIASLCRPSPSFCVIASPARPSVLLLVARFGGRRNDGRQWDVAASGDQRASPPHEEPATGAMRMRMRMRKRKHVGVSAQRKNKRRILTNRCARMNKRTCCKKTT